MTIIRHDDHHQEKQPSILRNKVILSILITETAERVAYFGFRAVLVLYFHNGLQFSESTSVSLFAAVSGLAYFSPLVGALFADSAWGRYLTILRFGAVYSIGLCLVTFAAYEASSLSSLSSSSCSSSVDGDGKECIDTNGEEGSHDENSMEDSLTIARLLSCFGLVLVCIGTGGIKPCVSAFGADQVVLVDNTYSHVGNEDITEKLPAPESSSGQEADRIREFFNSFYFCINVGALLSFAIIPIIRANYGFGAAFFIPTICMIAALGVFLSQRKSYKHRKRDSSQPSLFGILKMCSTIVLTESCYSKYFVSNNTTTTSSGSHMSVITANEETSNDIEEKHPVTTEITKIDDNIENNEENNNNIHKERQDAEQVLHIMPLMLFFPIFWMLYDQQGSVWTLQATRLNRHGLEPEQSGFINPLEIMVFIPLFDRIIYPWLDSKGYNIQPLRRMEYGMFLTAVAFFASTLLEFSIQTQPANSISLAWQIPQITILTIAEIFLNVTGLEFFYSHAPDNMQALILAVFLCMTAIGDGMGAVLFASVFRLLNSAVTMIICAVCMLLNLALFSRVARHWTPYQPNNRHRLENNDNDDDGEVELNTIITSREIN